MAYRDRKRRREQGGSGRGSAGGKARAGRSQEPAETPAPRRLPLASGWTSLFRAGEGGERRECANYERCLDAYHGTGPAYCPEGCPREEPPGEMPRATDYMSIDGGARGA